MFWFAVRGFLPRQPLIGIVTLELSVTASIVVEHPTLVQGHSFNGQKDRDWPTSGFTKVGLVRISRLLGAPKECFAVLGMLRSTGDPERHREVERRALPAH